MRARRGWIAALLLIALAVLGGPDPLHDKHHTKIAAAGSVEEHDQRAADDIDPEHWAADHTALNRRRLPGLPASGSQQHGHVYAAARYTGVVADADEGPSRILADGHPWRHLSACSPETLQVFRC